MSLQAQGLIQKNKDNYLHESGHGVHFLLQSQSHTKVKKKLTF